MGSCDGCIGLILVGFIASPAILQGIGLFGRDWVKANSCEEIGNTPPCCNLTFDHTTDTCSVPFRLRDLHESVYVMQWIAFGILFTPIACVLLDAYCSDDDDDDDYEFGACALLGGFCFLFYPIAGVLSFIGCMMILVVYSGQSFGSSFNLCLASGIYVILITGILIFLLCLKSKRKAQAKNQRRAVMQRTVNTGAAAPYGDFTHAVRVESTEVTAEVHDPETGGFIRFVRKVNVYHQLTHWSS